ncbi:MAG TPA: type I methionyl aminopeptidase [Bacteroidales bacterium]|nr:type I methionyl aminopeptidase [Bacteroidales bacterium]
MIFVKTESEIEKMRESNLMVSRTHAMLAGYIEPGVNTLKLDKLAEEFIRDNGGVPGFLNYSGYPNSLCISINDVVVHGIPSDYCLKDGDIVSIDCGVYKNGYHGDSCYTFEVGEVAPEVKQLLKVTREALYLGIEQAIHGNRVGHIGFAVQQHAEKNNYSVVRELVGHGIGKNLHEEPQVPNYGKRGRGPKLRENMTIAIEPMINMGHKEVKQMPDGWTIKTLDGKPSAHFEHTIVIKKDKAEILSNFEIIDKAVNKKLKK